MTFLQPFILWGLPLILLPVVIHMINRLRHKPQPWAAMRFLISATRASTSHAKLRQFLILLFRVLIVAMLLLFLARPLAGGWMGWMLSPAPDVVLILLDRSASMETKISATATKREQAIKLLSESAKEFGGVSHFVLIDSASRLPQEIVNPASMWELSLVSTTDTAADIPAMLQSAFNYLVENRAGSAEIWIASDLQRSNWQPEEAHFKNAISQLSSLRQKVRVRLLALDQRAGRNSSILIQDVSRQRKGNQATLQFQIDLQSITESTAPFPVQVVMDGATSETQVTMDGQSMRWRYKLDMGEKTNSGWGSFRLPVDANGQDNTTYFVYGRETTLRATVVSSDVKTVRYLQLAAGALGKNNSASKIVSPAEISSVSLDDCSTLIWQAPLPAGAIAEKVQRFVEQGGVTVFFPSENSDSKNLAGIGWGEIQNAGTDKMFPILKWDEEQGPLAKTDEGFSLPLGQMEFHRRQAITGQKTVLAAFDDGAPFLVRQTLGKGQIYFCASLPNPEWSSLGDGPVLVPMIQRFLQTGSKRLQQVSTVNCGELSPTEQQAQWTTVDSTVTKNIRYQAGIYRSGDRLLAVNRPSTEDDPEILDEGETKNLFTGISFQMLQERQKQTGALQGEVWRIFLFGMLLFLIGEGILILPGRTAVTKKAEGSA